MVMKRLARAAGDAVISRATWGGSQNFLGARWVERVVDNSPVPVRERVALRFLSLSPHYFYDPDLKGEDTRNRRSRQIIADQLIAPHLTAQMHVLDYGCGPGYLAAAVAEKAARVDALDISRGVLACARVINWRPNISFQTPAQFQARKGPARIDLAYSFAVVQHLRTGALGRMLDLLASSVRPGGLLMLHFAQVEGGWRTEEQWELDTSLRGRAKLRYGLNCFGRSPAEMTTMVEGRGFTDVTVRSLGGSLNSLDDDIREQHLLTARRCDVLLLKVSV